MPSHPIIAKVCGSCIYYKTRMRSSLSKQLGQCTNRNYSKKVDILKYPYFELCTNATDWCIFYKRFRHSNTNKSHMDDYCTASPRRLLLLID